MDEEFYRHLLDSIADGVYFVTLDRRITYWNHGAERITGYSAGEVLGHSCSEGILRHVNEAGRQLCLVGCPLAAVMLDGQDRHADVYLHHKDGHRVPVSVRGQAVHGPDGAIVGSVEVFSAELRNAFADVKADEMADSLDPVTRLPLRHFGEVRLKSMLAEVAAGEQSLGVLFLDVDNFKMVNDTHGHLVGDRVLHMVGQSVANALTRADLPVRWGGEEFLVLLPGADHETLSATGERVRMLVENSWLDLDGDDVCVTVSVGATLARTADTPEELLDRADQLMYKSKTSGRNHVTLDSEAPVGQDLDAMRGTARPWGVC